MKFIKYYFTSIVFLIFAIYGLSKAQPPQSNLAAGILFIICSALFLFFFILGWAVKDKPKPPRDTENDKDTKK